MVFRMMYSVKMFSSPYHNGCHVRSRKQHQSLELSPEPGDGKGEEPGERGAEEEEKKESIPSIAQWDVEVVNSGELNGVRRTLRSALYTVRYFIRLKV